MTQEVERTTDEGLRSLIGHLMFYSGKFSLLFRIVFFWVWWKVSCLLHFQVVVMVGVNVGGWSKFCDDFTSGGGCVFVCLVFSFFWSHKTQKKPQWCVKMEYKTKKKYIRIEECRIQRIFSSTLSHTIKWCNCSLKRCGWRRMKVMCLEGRNEGVWVQVI